MQSKIENLGNMSEASYRALMQSNGFQCLLKPGALLIVPAGFLIIILLPSGTEICEGMRWSFLRTREMEGSKAEVDLTLSLMKALLTDFGTGSDASIQELKDAIETQH